MTRNTNFRAWGSVGHYLQGPGLLEDIENYAGEFGQNYFYIIDVFFFETWTSKLCKMYENSENKFMSTMFEGEITHGKIQEFQNQTMANEIDTVIAIGGGKSIDVAKVIAAEKGTALVICPTIASTDAPTRTPLECNRPV